MCSACYQRDYLARNPEVREKRLARRRQAYKEDPEKTLKRSLCWRYGITVDEYEALISKQGGLCDICGSEPEGKLFVDHDHETGAVRSLLCNNCNFGLGQFKDSPELLLKAYNYLRKYKLD